MMSLAGRWSYAQVRAIHVALREQLVEENLDLVIYEITTFADRIHWYLIVLKRKTDGTHV